MTKKWEIYSGIWRKGTPKQQKGALKQPKKSYLDSCYGEKKKDKVKGEVFSQILVVVAP